MSAATKHRLDGFEPDNLLAFLALLGLLRAIDAADENGGKGHGLRPRIAWDLARAPLRPVLHVTHAVTTEGVAAAAAEGLEMLAIHHRFEGQSDLNHSKTAARELLRRESGAASVASRYRIDLLAALMSDGAVRERQKHETIDPTPLCLLFGQGHQHFLDRLSKVPAELSPPSRGRAVTSLLSAAECLHEALFLPWHRNDSTFSFRWDPEEDVRYALMAGDPTVAAYKMGTQHGANRLASIGLSVLTVVPQVRGGRVRAGVVGGSFGTTGFSFAWPIWHAPATLPAIRAMLAHPDVRTPGALAHLTVDHVLVSRRISVGKFMNFTRARPIEQDLRLHDITRPATRTSEVLSDARTRTERDSRAFWR